MSRVRGGSPGPPSVPRRADRRRARGAPARPDPAGGAAVVVRPRRSPSEADGRRAGRPGPAAAAARRRRGDRRAGQRPGPGLGGATGPTGAHRRGGRCRADRPRDRAAGGAVGTAWPIAPTRWSTPGCPTAPVSPRCCRRSRSTARSSRFAVTCVGRCRSSEFAGAAMVRVLHRLVDERANIVVYGPTGAGKTTVVNALAARRAAARTHRDHRGRRRAAAARRARRPARGTTRRRGRCRSGRDAGPRARRAAAAARPDHRRRGPRRRGRRHGVGAVDRPSRWLLDLPCR